MGQYPDQRSVNATEAIEAARSAAQSERPQGRKIGAN